MLKKNFIKGIGFVFISVAISLMGCNQTEENLSQNEGGTQSNTQQQEFIPEDLQSVEEPEFTIEAEYDPSLAQKVESSKKNKSEKQKPITLTADDDDLTEDTDDLPQAVQPTTRDEVTAYDYKPKNDDILAYAENTPKGGGEGKSETMVKEDGTMLFFVVAGAYRDEANAKLKADKLKKLGFEPTIINFDSNFKAVCVEKKKTRKEADELVEELKENKVDAYVLKRRN